jgi:hypothetical protein
MMYFRIFISTPECFTGCYFLSFKSLNPYIILKLKSNSIKGIAFSKYMAMDSLYRNSLN